MRTGVKVVKGLGVKHIGCRGEQEVGKARTLGRAGRWHRPGGMQARSPSAPVLEQQRVPELGGGEGEPLEELALGQGVQNVVGIPAVRACGTCSTLVQY